MRFANWIINGLAAAELLSIEERIWIYEWFGMTVGRGAYISPGCTFDHPNLGNISLGVDAFLNRHCHLENGAAITLSDRVRVGPGVRILTTSHSIGIDPTSRVGGLIREPVEIGEGCWVCTNAIILPGVKVAPGCVIAAGAVVTQSTEPNALYAGIPARRKKGLIAA